MCRIRYVQNKIFFDQLNGNNPSSTFDINFEKPNKGISERVFE